MPWKSGSSRHSASTVESSPATKNCTQESSTPLTWGATRSTTMMCREKKAALSSTSRSPGPMAGPPVVSLVTLSKYAPTRAMPTPIHTFSPGLRPKKMPSTGTITIYNAVKNPAFPAVVNWMPACCSRLPAPSSRPHRAPPPSRSFLPRAGSASWGFPAWSRRFQKISGSSTSPPM